MSTPERFILRDQPFPPRIFVEEFRKRVRDDARQRGELLTEEQLAQFKANFPGYKWKEEKLWGKIPMVTGETEVNLGKDTFSIELHKFLYCSSCQGWVSFVVPEDYDKDFMTEGLSCSLCHEELVERPSGRYID